MTIKDQIEDLLADYRKDFYEKTGLMLVAFPDKTLPKIDLYEIVSLTCAFYDVEEGELVRRTAKATKVKDAVTGLALKMNYSVQEIYKLLSIERSAFSAVRHRFSNNIAASKSYRYEFYRLLQYIEENVDNQKIILNTNWKNPTEYVEAVFIED